VSVDDDLRGGRGRACVNNAVVSGVRNWGVDRYGEAIKIADAAGGGPAVWFGLMREWIGLVK
jgi:hypothetical protein